MAIISKQVGWSQEAILYWEVLKEFNKLSRIASRVFATTTSTTTLSSSTTTTTIFVGDSLLLENGDLLVQENGDLILF